MLKVLGNYFTWAETG